MRNRSRNTIASSAAPAGRRTVRPQPATKAAIPPQEVPHMILIQAARSEKLAVMSRMLNKEAISPQRRRSPDHPQGRHLSEVRLPQAEGMSPKLKAAQRRFRHEIDNRSICRYSMNHTLHESTRRFGRMHPRCSVVSRKTTPTPPRCFANSYLHYNTTPLSNGINTLP